jgi:hypothetical protein
MNLLRISLLTAACFILTAACKKSKNNNIPPLEPGSLTALPIDEADFHVLVPLGSVGPPFQTFPKDHGGFYLKHLGTPANVKSPGKLRITQISRDRHDIGTPNESQDFSVYFGDNKQYSMYLGHLATISSKLLQAANNFAGANCSQYTAGTSSLQEKCQVNTAVEVEAGEILGTGGTIPGQNGVDFGLSVNGKIACLLDYFAAAPKAILSSKMGVHDPSSGITVLRTKPPLCGEVYQDVAGTLHGNWLKPGAPALPYDPHIAFVKDIIDPDKPLISIGTTLYGTPGLWTFTPLNTGFINRKFTDVTPGATYCYNNAANNASIIVKLTSATTISAEYRPGCNCSCATSYDFGLNVKTFQRQ